MKKVARATLLENHWFPAVHGPYERYYIVDHHHLGLALLREEVRSVKLLVLADFASLDEATFWRMMEHHQWVHPYDARGTRQTYDAIPRRIVSMVDDPYRSLAGEVRRAGGFAKDVTPFSEFLWADFYRPRIDISLIEQDLDRAVTDAKRLSHESEARHLPGWSGNENGHQR